MQVYTTVGAGAAGATATVVGAAGTTGVAGATAGVVGSAGAAGAEVFVDFAGVAGAVGAIVAAGVTALVMLAGTGLVALDIGAAVSTGTTFASVVFAANSAWCVFQAKLVTILTNAVNVTPSVAILERRAGCGLRFMINHHLHLHRHHPRDRHHPRHHRRHHLMDLDCHKQLKDYLMHLPPK